MASRAFSGLPASGRSVTPCYRVPMPLTVDARPSLPADLVASLVRDRFGMEGRLSPLPGEWDQNLRLDTTAGESYVVKIANRGHDTCVLDFQNRAVQRLAGRWRPGGCPCPVASIEGEHIVRLEAGDGHGYRVRVLTFVPGQPLAEIRPTDSDTLERLGVAAGELDQCLSGFEHGAMHRDMPWDLARPEWIGNRTRQITDPHRRGIVERMLLQYRARVRPALDALPAGVIHNDLNDENILLSAHEQRGWEVAGVLDFGDMLWSHTVNELAILCAYATMACDESVDRMASIARGYHRARPLDANELDALFPLTCMRLCVSVITSAIAALEDPDNAHRQISDAPAWALLEFLAGVEWDDARNRLRDSCGAGRRAL